MTTETGPHTLPLRALAALLGYPARDMVAAVVPIHDVLMSSRLLAQPQKERLIPLCTRLATSDLLDAEENWVNLFERGRRTSLHLFEHLHGESRDRGSAMVDLLQTYETAGLYLQDGELPDYLPALLEFCSCVDMKTAQTLIADCAHLLRPLGETLLAKGSDYAAIFEAILQLGRQDGLDWTRAAPPPELEDIDKEWQEEPAFGHQNTRCGNEPVTQTIQFMSQPAARRSGASS
ncbi:nitrate reductase molybdenum cofactor assembly chaperone [Silvimonas iriomotensis]|uniref:Nitrate reductase molybdenum cofactor assembly chaperone n=1 Tax=Silvimonas iriomotensis TaxID=449662 RepID=A0ABQ2PCT2_9NEIS|nr:nitrate reductase molybdenum cofactor assembly chaperone [Silvimonas iriomotensis]GGP23267.1 nitrate reductase molybdenum cofactor assembly chaperone [Silvimonas iriomotensis]